MKEATDESPESCRKRFVSAGPNTRQTSVIQCDNRLLTWLTFKYILPRDAACGGARGTFCKQQRRVEESLARSGSVTNAGGMGDVRDEARKFNSTSAARTRLPRDRRPDKALTDSALSHEPEGWERRRGLKTGARRDDFIDGNLACSELRELVVHVTFVGSSRRIKGALIELHFEHRHFCIRGMNILIVQPGEERIKTQRRPMSRSLPTLQSASPRATEGSGGVPIDRDREVQLVGFLEGSNGTRDGSVDR
ncbi:hypothetical protein EDB92DRAFT_1820948 [Lactarius akahatsu]|uniref:Uncharacterized protein n=1 Tax=Lactarius akahatsu TaxID=416441 RepID=A0AAD4Q8C0_9AGAM|nr:hypothetical protein EDB92DRAFT_1820948 [Lactarius akahatsu]